MSQAIKVKQVRKGKQFDEHAKRYMFYPLHNLDMASTQATNPVWILKIPRSRIFLLESFEYMDFIVDNESPNGGGAMGERTMGTGAQVSFLMGNSEGSGWLEKGMTYIDSLTGVEPEVVMAIEAMIIPTEIPDNLFDLRAYVEAQDVSADPKLAELAMEVKAEILTGIDRAIRYCESHTANLENELNNAKQGGAGIRALTRNHVFYFKKIGKPLPEDKAGVNMGSELAKVLAPFIAKGVNTDSVLPAQDKLADDIEKQEMQKKIEALEAQNKELAEAIEANE